MTVTPLSLTVGEGGSGTYTVVLNTQPSGDVTVAISSNNTDVSASPSPLTFTTTTWSTEQTVTVSAGQDDDAANDTAALTHNPERRGLRLGEQRHPDGDGHGRRDGGRNGHAHVADDRRGRHRHVHRVNWTPNPRPP